MTASVETDYLALATAYLAALESGVTGDELARFFDAAVVQEEFPNRLTPNGATRDLAALLAGAVQGKKVMSAQRYTILAGMAAGNRVALEVDWRGTLAIAAGTLAAGDEMQARFAVFLEYEGDRIVRQRNYDCFTPW